MGAAVTDEVERGPTRARLETERLVWIDDFLDPEECAAVLDELHFAWWWPSTLVDPTSGSRYRTARRQSETTTQWWFVPPLLDLVAGIEARLHETLAVDPLALETWQGTRYGPGGRFSPHVDAGLDGAGPAGDRRLTVLLYLDEPAAGGETAFPCLGLAVRAVPGRLLVWANLLPDGSVDRTMLHASRPVERGTKATLVNWARQRPLRSPAAPGGGTS
jgi:prolyl 4-hydroxylase